MFFLSWVIRFGLILIRKHESQGKVVVLLRPFLAEVITNFTLNQFMQQIFASSVESVNPYLIDLHFAFDLIGIEIFDIVQFLLVSIENSEGSLPKLL